ncbi:MAG: hypothetical protein JSV26_00695 [bacterium]|nr:MAG: hypothetical protein JSV26_00695 [bacterium]
MKRTCPAFLAVVASLIVPAVVLAHGASILAHWEGQEVHTDSYSSDGRPIPGARVAVYDMGGRVLFEGVTDDTGALDFPKPGAGDLRIIMTAPSGHRSETVLTEVSRRGEAAPVRDTGGPGKAVDEALEKKLVSIQESIQDLHRKISKPRIPEILGGVGWIVGLAGAYLWGMSRNNRRREDERERGGE